MPKKTKKGKDKNTNWLIQGDSFVFSCNVMYNDKGAQLCDNFKVIPI